MKKIYEVEKYLKLNPKRGGLKYALQIGGLTLYFSSRREANDYYLKYLK